MLQNQNHLFSIPKDITYLNIASQSPAFKAIYEAGLEGLKQKNQPYTIRSTDYFEPVKKLKQLFAKLIHADDYNRIATIPSVSYGMATIANNIEINKGDEIIIVGEQFPSNYYSWKKLADKNEAVIKIITHPKENKQSVKQWNSNILDAITDKTAFVAMGNIHWSNGSLFDLKAIRKKTQVHKALLIIDGSQTIGAYPFSVKELQPDALICAGYKWLFGPYGCAYGYFGEYFDNGTPIEENWSNRLNSENFAGLTNYQPEYKPLSNKYAVGESGNFIYVKMQIKALEQVITWTPKAIQTYCKNISREAVFKLKELGCKIEEDEYRTHHLFGIELPKNLDLDALKKDLYDRKIFVSFRGNYIRISCHLYNTAEDFKPLIACLSNHI